MSEFSIRDIGGTYLPSFYVLFLVISQIGWFLAHLINIATKKQNEMKRQNTVKTEEENIPQAKAMFKF